VESEHANVVKGPKKRFRKAGSKIPPPVKGNAQKKVSIGNGPLQGPPFPTIWRKEKKPSAIESEKKNLGVV